jgi:XTP/dITP diphosphohydrolase
MEIVLATGNTHKKEELTEIVHPHSVLVPSELGVRFDFPETGSTYLENAYGKADHLFGMIGRPVIADDSGLSVPALGGEPGVYSARYGAGPNGERLQTAERNRYLLEKMVEVTDRRAFFVCCMVLILEEYRFFIVEETVHGEITLEPAGTGGFGYDPVFYLPERHKTMAELPEGEKNKISHRGKAGLRIKQIIDLLET